MGKGMLLLLAGSSGSGKNTLINFLTKERQDVEFLVSHTTREMREGEADGKTYHFVSVNEFERAIKNNEMLEYDVTHKGYYGISKRTITDTLNEGKVVVKDISVLGVINCKKQLSHRVLINSIFLTESKKVLKERLIKRGEKNYKLRLKIYHKEQSQMGVCDYIIRNTQLNNSISIVEAIIDHGTNNLPLLPYKTVRKISNFKVNHFAKRIEKGHKLKPMNVALIKGKIYIVDCHEKYLASLKANKAWPKKFITEPVSEKRFSKGELEMWTQAVEKFDK